MTPPTDKPLSRTMTARAPQARSASPATDMVAGRSRRPARFHPVFIDMCPKGQDAVPQIRALRSGRSGLGLARDLRGVLVGAAGDLVAQPDQRVVLTPDDPLLHRDQRVVGDLDVLRADLGAALGDVAQAQAEVVLGA